MFFEKAVEAMDRLTALSVNFMAKVVALLNNNETDEDFVAILGDYVDQASQIAALTVSFGNTRYVVKEIFNQKDGVMYYIRSGLPAHRNYHGFGQSGPIYEPRKGALADALEQRKIVYVEDVHADPRTQYVLDVARKFGVRSLVVVPFIFENIKDFSFLLVVDIIDRNISEEELTFLERVGKSVTSTVDSAYRARRDLVAKLHHEIRNPSMSIGGFASRLLKGTDKKTSNQYLKIIMGEVGKLEDFADRLGDSCVVNPFDMAADAVEPLLN